MTNALVKRTNFTYTAGSPGVAASAGSPARAAYTGVEQKLVCGFQPLQPTQGSYQLVTDSFTGQTRYVFVPSTTNTAVPYGYTCTLQNVSVSYPAQPYIAPTPGVPSTPAQTAYDYNIGWNSGARSIGSFTGQGFVQFLANASVSGAVVGLNDSDFGGNYTDIDYGFYVTHGIARVFELGIEKLYIGPVADGAVFRIERRYGIMRYFIGGAVVYTSLVPSTGALFLDASLYSGGDTIDAPVIGELYTAQGSVAFPAPQFYGTGVVGSAPSANSSVAFPPMSTYGTQGVSYAQSNVAFPAMTTDASTAPKYAQSSVSFPALTTNAVANPNARSSVSMQPMLSASADRPYAAAALSFEPLVVQILPGQVVPSYALATAIMSPMSSGGLILTGGLAQGSVAFDPMYIFAADRPYAVSGKNLSFPPMQTTALAYEGNRAASMLGQISAPTFISLFGKIDVALVSSLTSSTTMATLVLKDAAIAESLSVGTTIQYSAIMQALMNSVIESFAGIPVLAQQGDVWVVNDDTGASSNYEDFGFTSYAKFQGRYYGVKSDGVYLLEGSTDKGAPIRSSISLGRHDFGSTAKKIVPNCYIGLSSSGNVFLKVIADGQTYLYKTVRSNGALTTQRVKLGKGLKATHLVFELYNETGADFEIDSIEFEVARLERRI